MKINILKLVLSLIFIFIFQVKNSAQWVLKTSFGTNDFLYDVHFLDNNIGYAAGAIFIQSTSTFEGIIIKSTNGGDNWNTLNIGTLPSLRSIYFIDNLIGLAVGDNGTIIKTIDGGINWTQPISGTVNNLESIFFISPTSGYICGKDIILKTTNGGDTWDIFPIAGLFSSIYFTDLNTGYALGIIPNSGIGPPIATFIIKTIDGGLNWVQKYYISNKNLSSVHFINSTIGYAVGYDIKLKTIDGGDTWNILNLPNGAGTSSVFFTSIDTGYAVGIDYSIVGEPALILKTVDGGINWNKQIVSSSVHLSDIQFINSSIGFTVGGRGGIGYEIHKTINGGETITNTNSNKNNFSKFNIYPNPSPSGNFILESEQVKSVELVSIDGKIVFTQTINQPKTELRTGLPKGLYFVKITFENKKQVIQKLIVSE